MKTPNIFQAQGLNALNENANRVVNYLCDQARNHPVEHYEDYAKIDNSDGVFMPVVVEILSRHFHDQLGRFEYVSIAHYGEQNGDLMADPEMTFCLWTPEGESEGYAFPMTYKNDFAYNYEDQGLEIDGETLMPKRYSKEKIAEYIDFCDMWMNNIREQQELPLTKAA